MNDVVDPWEYWRAMLAGRKPQANESNPQCGFYRWPFKDGYMGKRSFTPVAYWPSLIAGELNCCIGGEDVNLTRGRDIWVSVSKHPVTETAFRVVEKGGRWPDEHELVPMDRASNRAPSDDSFEGLRDAIEPLATEAKRLLAGPPAQNQDEADRISNLADRLAELHKKADEKRKAEKAPHDEASKAVQTKWLPLVEGSGTFKNLKYKCVTPFLLKQDAEQQAEKLAAVMTEEWVPQQEEPPRPRAGTRGRAMSLRTFKRANITDWAKALALYGNNPEVRAVIQDLANRAVRAGVELEFATVVEEKRAV